jgi:hypothetical protein
MYERNRFDQELLKLGLFQTAAAVPAPAKVKRRMKLEIQTNSVLYRVKKGSKPKPLPRKWGPQGFLVESTGTNTIELQAEAHGYVEFETPHWSHDWCELKERVQAAVDMVDAMNKAPVLRTKTRTVGTTTQTLRYIKFPFNVDRLARSKYADGLGKGESLEVEILEAASGDPQWWAKIQASESFKLSQFDSYLKEHQPSLFTDADTHATNILNQVNTAALPVTNLRSLLLIILSYIKGVELSTTAYDTDHRYDKYETTPLAKEHIFLASRTNFSWIYRQFLSNDERKLFKTIVVGRTLLKELGKTRKTRLFTKGFKGRRSQKVTIHKWLISIYAPTKTKTGERDILSNIGGDNRAMGRFPDESKPIKNSDRQLVKFEARGIDPAVHQQEGPVGDWLTFAKDVFKTGHDKRNLPGSKLSYHPSKCP